jgi:hypothetical protein
MGFEVIYYYKEATEISGVYSEETFTKTSKIGKFEEDVSFEVLAGKIMAQLARRNILITDIEIYEFAKKKINYKETKDGIIIKNKKFSFDSGAVVGGESNDEDIEEILQNEELLSKLKKVIGFEKPQINLANRQTQLNADGKRPLRMETYEPELLTKHKMDQRGFKLTVGKKYPIFSEKKGLGTINYITIDDSGREVEIGAECFVASSMGLSFQEDGSQIVGGNSCEINLWKNMQSEDQMPEIRGR